MHRIDSPSLQLRFFSFRKAGGKRPPEKLQAAFVSTVLRRLLATGCWLLLTLLVACVSNAAAQVTTIEDDAGNQPPTYKMTVSPAPEPRPALKYHFLVPAVDQVDGNAATFYYKSMVFEDPDWVRELDQAPLEDKVEEWLKMPLEKLPQQEIRDKAIFIRPGYQWQAMTEASRCNRCDWGDPIREEGISTPLPQAQKMRSVARGIALRVRMEIAQQKYSDAINTLRLGYALSQNMGHGCGLVQSLIGSAIQDFLGDQTRTLIAVENSPNLYWALSELAEKPIKVGDALSFEARLWEFSVHELADLDRRTFSNNEALHAATKVWSMWGYMGSGKQPPPDTTGELFFWAVRSYPAAEEYLLHHGFTTEKIAAMPVLQTVLLHRWRQYEEVRDDYFKIANLPDNEFLAFADQAERQVRDAERSGHGMPFTAFLPAIQAGRMAAMRSQRHTDLLRVVEALRLYAVDHGSWPDSLDDITAVPVPHDAMTGKPFVYSVKDGIATLTTASAIGQIAPWTGARYELTLRGAKTSKTGGKQEN